MKNTRSANLDTDFTTSHQISTDPPPIDSLFWQLWHACVDIAQQAEATAFIQGIKAGTLDPTKYGGFNVSDAYYCFHGASDYLTASHRATDPTLKDFLLKKYSSYEQYNQTFPSTWHIKNGDSLAPMPVTKSYSDFETRIARTEDPIYTLIAMLPCEYLWAWLGEQLSPPEPHNLYGSWITGNDDPSGAYAMGNFIAAYQLSHQIDTAKALSIYRQAMTYEYQNFKAGA